MTETILFGFEEVPIDAEVPRDIDTRDDLATTSDPD